MFSEFSMGILTEDFSTEDPLDIMIRMEERAALMAALSKKQGKKIFAEALQCLCNSSREVSWRDVVRIARHVRQRLLEMEGLI